MKRKNLTINAVLNVIKQCCSIVFPMITFPYVSRILHARNYGKFSFATALVSYFSLIASLGIHTYAVREGSRLREDKLSLERFATQIFVINVITTIVAYIFMFITMIFWGKLDEYRILIIICSSNIIFTTLGREWINYIFEDYLYITLRYVLTYMLSLVCVFMFIQTEHDYVKYAVISVMASIISNICNLYYTRRFVSIHLKYIDLQEVKKHMIPILTIFGSTIGILIYTSSDSTIIGILKGDSVLGIYSVVAKIYLMVKTMLNSIITVTVPRFSYLSDSEAEDFNFLFNKMFRLILLIILPAISGLVMISKEIIVLISGYEYIEGTFTLQIMSIALIFANIAALFVQCILLPKRCEVFILMATVTSAVVNILLNLIFVPWLSYNGAAVTTLLAELMVCCIVVFKSRTYIDLKSINKTWSTAILGCFVIVMICGVCAFLFETLALRAIMSITLSIIIYAFILLFRKEEIAMLVLCSIKDRIKKGTD